MICEDMIFLIKKHAWSDMAGAEMEGQFMTLGQMSYFNKILLIKDDSSTNQIRWIMLKFERLYGRLC